jgi:hypothetical protein
MQMDAFLFIVLQGECTGCSYLLVGSVYRLRCCLLPALFCGAVQATAGGSRHEGVPGALQGTLHLEPDCTFALALKKRTICSCFCADRRRMACLCCRRSWLR